MNLLDVYMEGLLIGHLADPGDGLLQFTYAHAWLVDNKAAPFAPGFPLAADKYIGREVTDYFDNLLPEGHARDFIARSAHISPDNVFALLERLGGDTAGAISLLPHGQRYESKHRYFPVTAEEIKTWFSGSQGIPVDIGEPVRMSLSGAQTKMALFIDTAGNMAVPLGAAPSTHIIKPSSTMNASLPDMAVNESLIMGLARACKLNVPDVGYSPALDAAVITRYDRQKGEDGVLHRLHQNDLCQLMSIGVERKYESEGGPTLKACFSTVQQYSSQPALDKMRLIEWLVFNLAVGNMDSHAKNISMLISDKGARLAPFYDLVCTTVYPLLSKRFAFKVGTENRPGWIMERHWQRFAAEIEVNPQLVKKITRDICERITQAWMEIAQPLRESVPHPAGINMINRIEKEIKSSVKRLLGRL
ncbi:MAG: type II toxin-antitoxin system HipA family toxin [Enterobacteriaceae bacterium]